MIDKIIAPYIENVKKELQVLNDQTSFLSWGTIKRQGTSRIQERLAELGVMVVMVPKNMAQPLDVTINGTIKKIEKKKNSVFISPPQLPTKC